MFDFFTAMALEFGRSSNLTKFVTILSLAPLLTFILWVGSLLGLRNVRKRFDGLREDAKALEVERDNAEARASKEAQRADSWSVDVWLLKAKVAETEGDDAAAETMLREGFERSRVGLAEVNLALSSYSLVNAPYVEGEIDKARRHAQIAELLTPGNRDAQLLLEDADMLENSVNADCESAVPTDATASIDLVEKLRLSAIKFMEAGRYELAWRIANRALFTAHQLKLEKRQILALESEAARFMGLTDNYEKAFKQICAVIAGFAELGIERDREVLLARVRKAEMLVALFRHAEGMSEIETVLKAFPFVEAQDVWFTAKQAQANVLLETGQLQECLEVLDEFIPIQDAQLGKNHRSSLSSHAMKALAMSDQPAEALAYLERLIPSMFRIFGEEHPEYLSLMLFELTLFHRLGRVADASDALKKLRLKFLKVYEIGHPRMALLDAIEAKLRETSNNPTSRPI